MAHLVPHNPLNHSGPAARAAQGRAAPQPPAQAPIAHVNLDRGRLSLLKGEHRWRFRWERGSEAALISAVADLARNPHMDFDWFDAAVVCRHIAHGAGPQASSAHIAQHPAAHISPSHKID